MFLLNNFYNDNKLPRIPIYVDSPLAVNATDIFRRHLNLFNDDVAEVLEYDDDPFGFNSLKYITNVNHSKALNSKKTPASSFLHRA